ncbi:MAG TPA: Hsp20/alpha crystallin family protein [Bacteroidetes bacterium]|nr:Hsp20/alpha crystallin family protein [Bacteroidota bacterium]
MLRPNIRNRTFDWMGEKYAPIIDRNHFLGRSSLAPVWGKKIPYANLKKSGQIFELELIVPGFNKEDITITIEDDIMTIKGQKKETTTKKTEEYVLKEYQMDSFERKFQLANNIGHEKVEAEYKNGILKIKFIDVPKEEEKKYKKVEVD